MSSFREQLGEDWLRYQHHLDDPPTQAPLPNGLTATATPRPSSGPGQRPSPSSLEVLPPPLLSSELKADAPDADGDLEQESTLQWPGENARHTESTLENSTVDGQGGVSSPGPSPESQRSVRAESGDTKEEEEVEDLGGRPFKETEIVPMCLKDLSVAYLGPENTKSDISISMGINEHSLLCLASGPVSPSTCGRLV